MTELVRKSRSTLLDRALRLLHKVRLIRKTGKWLFSGISIGQPFHGGRIYCDMVDHSWAWIHGPQYESFDRTLQDELLKLSESHNRLVDIGCNVGAMSLSVLLRNPNINVVAIDPNPRALKLLRKSACANGVNRRLEVVEGAVSDIEGSRKFDFSGSVVGHISEYGLYVNTISFSLLLNKLSDNRRVLAKVDVEGHETTLFKQISEIKNLKNLTLVSELHPKGMNGEGDPEECLLLLKASDAILTNIDGTPLLDVDPRNFSQIIARWN